MKPFNSEIIDLMARHSNECAIYASAMKWDFWRRQKIEDVTEEDLRNDCGLCVRHGAFCCYNGKCALYAQQGNGCTKAGYWAIAKKAFLDKDQQTFTTAANDLYFQIRSIIDDLYKPEPKKEEVFYKRGDRFRHKQSDAIYQIIYANGYYLTNVESGLWYHDPPDPDNEAEEANHITKEEFRRIAGPKYNDFILIPDKKK